MNDNLIVGCLEIDLAAYQVSCSGTALHLSATEIDLLALLITNERRVASRSELATALGKKENTIDLLIAKLRRRLGPGFIRTVRSKGWAIHAAGLDCRSYPTEVVPGTVSP